MENFTSYTKALVISPEHLDRICSVHAGLGCPHTALPPHRAALTPCCQRPTSNAPLGEGQLAASVLRTLFHLRCPQIQVLFPSKDDPVLHGHFQSNLPATTSTADVVPVKPQRRRFRHAFFSCLLEQVNSLVSTQVQNFVDPRSSSPSLKRPPTIPREVQSKRFADRVKENLLDVAAPKRKASTLQIGEPSTCVDTSLDFRQLAD